MNTDIANGRMERELRRRQLAIRLMGHRARTQAIEGLTGLTRHQLETLRRGAGVPTDSRFRGPAPTSVEVFFSCARKRAESAVLALLYWALGASKFSKRNASSAATIELGEQLCDVYEIWRQLAPSSDMEFDQFTLLAEGVSRNDRIRFAHCGDCHAIILIDRLGSPRKLCDHCARARREEAASSTHPETAREDEETDLVLYGLQLLGGQIFRDRKGGYAFDDGSSVPD